MKFGIFSGKKQDDESRRARNLKWIKRMWICFAILVAVIIVFFVMAYNGVIGYMPPVEELKNPNDRFATVIYSADGQEMGRYYNRSGNRVYAEFDEISQNVVDALIATEDARFEDHSGIDLRAVMRAVVKTGLMGQRSAGGGSTITQQLAKQLYSPTSENIFQRALQKPIEWMIAIKLERFYSKEEIIKMYLNQFDFLYNAVGIKTAADVYFRKDARDLDLHEAAMLVGMVKNPSLFNPVRHPERAITRRNVVFEQMLKADMINDSQFDSLCALPLGLNFHRVDHKDGIAPYFREELRRILSAKKPVRSSYPSWNQQAFIDDSIAWVENPLFGWIEKNPKPDGTKYNLYADGLKIYTTIDSRMQQYAEEAVNEHMRDLQARFFKEKKGAVDAPYTSNTSELSPAARKRLMENAINQSERMRVAKIAGLSKEEIERQFNTPVPMTVFSYDGPVDTVMTPRDSIFYHKHFLRTGFMSMDPRNGYVKAYVGGPDFHFFQYDMVSTGRRQIGSTVKPFLYTIAMEEGMTPCTRMLNEQPMLYDESGRLWMPRNAGTARIGEMVDLRWALTNSNNWISARIMDRLQAEKSLPRMMHTFGITNKLPEVKSLCLGSGDVSVKEMVGAYTAFANKGLRVDPLYVTSIVDNNGNVVATFSPRHSDVIGETAYYRMLSMLLNVVDSGTGNRIRRAPYNVTAQTGGKTGTTNFNADGWFMAFTPDLVSGTWVGGDERYIHFNSMANGQGASMALPIYGRYIRKVYDDANLGYSESARFSFPSMDLCAGDFFEEPEEEVVDSSIGGAFD